MEKEGTLFISNVSLSQSFPWNTSNISKSEKIESKIEQLSKNENSSKRRKKKKSLKSNSNLWRKEEFPILRKLKSVSFGKLEEIAKEFLSQNPLLQDLSTQFEETQNLDEHEITNILAKERSKLFSISIVNHNGEIFGKYFSNLTTHLYILLKDVSVHDGTTVRGLKYIISKSISKKDPKSQINW